MKKLTTKQKLVFETIREMAEKGLGEINSYKLHKFMEREGIKVGDLKGTIQVVDSLEKKELIKRDANRIIYLVDDSTQYDNPGNIFSLPVYGLASCGEALAYAQDNVDGYLQISKSLFRKENPAQLFAVKVTGDSMDKEGILDGDYVVFEKQDPTSDFENKIVVAVINGMATIKRYKKFPSGMIGLFPNSSNPYHQPIYLDQSDQVLIAGVFRKVLPVKYTSW